MNKKFILERASELFLKNGCKLVTMDLVAMETGTSKRTLYELFGDKSELVRTCVLYLRDKQDEELKKIIPDSKNVLDLMLKAYARRNDAVAYLMEKFRLDIKKHYYGVYSTTVVKLKEENRERILKFLEKGKEEGVFMKGFNAEIAALMIIETMASIKKEEDTIKNENYSLKQIMKDTLFLYIRGLTTNKGMKIIDGYLENN